MEENPVVALLLAIALIILASRLGGGVARRFGQPRVLGELIIGVLLGPTLLDMLSWPVFQGTHLAGTIKELAEIGVVLLMFIVGMEVKLDDLRKVGRVGTYSGVLGAIIPIALSFPVLLLFGYTWEPALFAGVTLAATSVSISAQVLLELGHLQTKVGNALLATALIDDVLAILLVSVTIAVVGGSGAEAATSGGAAEILLIILQMALYIVVAFLVAWFIVPRIITWVYVNRAAGGGYGLSAAALIMALLFAWSAEYLGGVAMITGSFIAGVGISQAPPKARKRIDEAMSHIAYAFLVPIFFVDVGLETDLSTFPLSALPLALMLLAIAIVSKVAGCGLGARLGNFNNQESLRLGVCMISRGEVGLIIASLGLGTGVFGQGDPLFSALFLVILLTTLVTPIFVRFVFPTPQPKASVEGASVHS